MQEISDDFREPGEKPLRPKVQEARKRLVATLMRDLFNLKHRAVQGTVAGSGLQERDSEWCYPIAGNDSQLGELKHPVTVEGEGSTDIFGWQFRMYFAAPLVEPALLLFLVFARKPSSSYSSEWQAIQNGHITKAKSEFNAWHANRRLGNSLPPGTA
ncbi:hypothetical protein [Mycolicibacterium parafortuitum]|uniref:hypothetical protein n=1 Tax=Mycolicibacterium parafortuitum TaxID=39692 RepID=UPI0032C49FF0